MNEDDDKVLHSERVYLQRISRDLKTLLGVMSKFAFSMEQAESEIPESMRRFTNYMHDVHDITYMYEQRGLPLHQHHLREMERCDDRYRQLLKKQNDVGGAFGKVRAEMAKDEQNRWDHSKQLTFQREGRKETSNGKPPVAEE